MGFSSRPSRPIHSQCLPQGSAGRPLHGGVLIAGQWSFPQPLFSQGPANQPLHEGGPLKFSSSTTVYRQMYVTSTQTNSGTCTVDSSYSIDAEIFSDPTHKHAQLNAWCVFTFSFAICDGSWSKEIFILGRKTDCIFPLSILGMLCIRCLNWNYFIVLSNSAQYTKNYAIQYTEETTLLKGQSHEVLRSVLALLRCR
jgi:hypothetical protein